MIDRSNVGIWSFLQNQENEIAPETTIINQNATEIVHTASTPQIIQQDFIPQEYNIPNVSTEYLPPITTTVINQPNVELISEYPHTTTIVNQPNAEFVSEYPQTTTIINQPNVELTTEYPQTTTTIINQPNVEYTSHYPQTNQIISSYTPAVTNTYITSNEVNTMPILPNTSTPTIINSSIAQSQNNNNAVPSNSLNRYGIYTTTIATSLPVPPPTFLTTTLGETTILPQTYNINNLGVTAIPFQINNNISTIKTSLPTSQIRGTNFVMDEDFQRNRPTYMVIKKENLNEEKKENLIEENIQ